jgi:hypothetical protein
MGRHRKNTVVLDDLEQLTDSYSQIRRIGNCRRCTKEYKRQNDEKSA